MSLGYSRKKENCSPLFFPVIILYLRKFRFASDPREIPQRRVDHSQVLGGSGEGGGGGAGTFSAFILSFLRLALNRNSCCFLLCLLFDLAKNLPLSSFLR
jgi:hypothetical protein